MHKRHCSTTNQRVQMVSELIANEGKYGIISSMSSRHEVSRETLYDWKGKGKEALQGAFTPREEPREEEERLERAVLTLLTEAHASTRGIQVCLERLLGLHVATGKISRIVQQAGKRARVWMEQNIPKGMRALAIDEQYGSKRGEAYLNIVDVHSDQVLASVPPVAVDAESWTLLLWQMHKQGLRWNCIVSDGGKAIQSAVDDFKPIQDEGDDCKPIQDEVQELPPKQVHQRDVWHVLDECQKVQRRLDRQVEEWQNQTKTVRGQAARVAAGKKPLGVNPKTDVQAHVALVKQAEHVASGVRYLRHELQRLLSVVVLVTLPEPSLLSSHQRREELDTLLDLLAELYKVAPTKMQGEVGRLHDHIQSALPRLLGFVEDLDAVHEIALQEIGPAAVHLIGWAWLHRAILGQRSQLLVNDFPPEWRACVSALLCTWDQAVRSSSCVENWHSVLRPFLAVHRSLSAGMLALLAVWHNHRVAPRGLHEGQSPMQRSGLEKEATDWLVALGYPSASPTPATGSLVSVKPDQEILAA